MSEQAGFVPVVDRISALLDRVVGWLCALLFGSMTLVVLNGVFFRYVLNSPLSWPEEVSRYLMIWGASAAISLGVRADEHVGLTILLDSLKSRVLRGILSTFVFMCVLAFFGFMFVYSVQMVIEGESRFTLDLGISMVLPMLAVPTAMALAAVQVVLNFLIRLGGGGPQVREMKVIDI